MSDVIIGFDIDEPLAPFQEYFLPFLNRGLGTNYAFEDIKHFELERNFKELKNSQESIDYIFRFYRTQEFAEMPHVNGSHEGTLELISMGYDLVAITSRPKKIGDNGNELDMEKLTGDWLKRNFSSIFSDVKFARDFMGCHGEKKVDICRRLDVQIFVEDNYDYAKDCALAGIRTLLYDHPWNRNKEMLPNLERVHSWEEILKKI